MKTSFFTHTKLLRYYQFQSGRHAYDNASIISSRSRYGYAAKISSMVSPVEFASLIFLKKLNGVQAGQAGSPITGSSSHCEKARTAEDNMPSTQ
jgi:hypothetical protein